MYCNLFSFSNYELKYVLVSTVNIDRERKSTYIKFIVILKPEDVTWKNIEKQEHYQVKNQEKNMSKSQ